MKMLEQPATGLMVPAASEQPWETLLPTAPAGKALGLSLARAAVRWPLGIWGSLDAVVAVMSMLYGHLLSPHFGVAQLRYEWTTAAMVFAGALIVANYALGMYDRHNFASRQRIIAFSA